jgi:hypothetical protein
LVIVCGFAFGEWDCKREIVMDMGDGTSRDGACKVDFSGYCKYPIEVS